MTALKIRKDTNVFITHNGKEREFTPQEFKELVSKFLVYYREGKTDVAVDALPSSYEQFFQPPTGFDSEYWAHRWELYHAADFEITYYNPKAKDVDRVAFLKKIKTLVTKEQLIEGLNAWKEFDANLDSSLESLKVKYEWACSKNPLLYATAKLAYEMGNIRDANEAQKLNPVYSQMATKDCCQDLISKLVRGEDVSKSDILLKTTKRNNFCQNIIDLWK